MGCDCSALKEDSHTANEGLIHTYEAGLWWKPGSLRLLLEELQGLETNLTGRQLISILVKLHVKSPDLRDCASPVTHLYACLKTKKLYSQRKLVLLAILLGAGKAIEAAEMLEKQYLLGTELVDVAAIAADMCELAIIVLPLYTELELERAQDTASLLKLTNYTEMLKQGRADAVSQLRNAILGEESCIRLGNLRARLQETGNLMLSKALRKRTIRRPVHKPARLNSILKTPVTSPLTSPPSALRSVRFLLDSAEPTE
jgi:hypothetical protein